RLSLPDERRLVAPRSGEMPIEAVVADVEPAADEPLGHGGLPVEDAVPRGEPAQPLGLLAPEAVRIVDGAPIELIVAGTAPDVCAVAELRRGREDAILAQHGIDGGLRLAVAHSALPATRGGCRARRVVAARRACKPLGWRHARPPVIMSPMRRLG